MRLLVYALGGGLGHVQRSLALGRAAARRGHETAILTNSPTWPRIADFARFEGVEVVHLAGTDAPAVARSRVEAEDFDVLVVDTLPRGISGDLGASLRHRRVSAVFVHRDLDELYAARPEVVEATRLYDLVFEPGERGPLADSVDTVATAPWLLLDSFELAGRSSARIALGLTDDRPALVVCDSANPREAHGLTRLADGWRESMGADVQVKIVGLEETWPLLRLHPGIDLLVGAAGYHTVWEARATGTPFKAIPRSRLYDRRARDGNVDDPIEDWPPVVAVRTGESVEYANGAHAAVAAVEQLIC